MRRLKIGGFLIFMTIFFGTALVMFLLDGMPTTAEWVSLGIGTLVGIITCMVWSQRPIQIAEQRTEDESGGEQWVIIGFIVLSIISRFILGPELTTTLGLALIPFFILFSSYLAIRILSS